MNKNRVINYQKPYFENKTGSIEVGVLLVEVTVSYMRRILNIHFHTEFME